jgi:TP901 family phage tail tape measure protein
MPSGRDIRAGAAYIELYANDNQLVRGLERAQKKLKSFGESVRKAGYKLLELSGVLAAPLVAGVKVFADFDKQMAEVATMLDDPAKHMEGFRKGILDMAVDSGQSTETLARGLYNILSAAIPADKALGVLKVATDAAEAGITETGVAADAITSVLNAYGLSAEHAGDVSDLLFTIVKRGKTTFGEIAPAIGNVATIAATAGLSFDELGAAFSVMTRNGVRTDNAVVALNAILSSFLKPSKAAKDLAHQLGFEMSTATLKTEGLAGVFQRISKLPPEMIAKLFPNIRALKGVLPALGNMEGFLGDIAAMGSRAGATEKAYTIIGDNLSHSFERLKQSGLAILAAIGEALSGPIKKAAALVIKWAANVRELITNHKDLVIAAAKVVAIIAIVGAAFVAVGTAGAALAFVFGGIASIISGIITVFGVIGSVIGAILTPVGLVITAIVALGGYIIYATGAGGKAIEWLSGKFSGLKEDAAAAWQGIGDALAAGDIGLAAKILWLTLKMEWQKGVNFLEEKWIGFKRWFLEIATDAFYGFLEIVTIVGAAIQTAWANVVAFMDTHFAGFTNGVRIGWNETQGFLAKRWIDLMGLWDSTLNVDEVKKSIDEDTARQNAEADKKAQRTPQQIESERQAAVTGIANDRDKRLIDLDRAERDTNRKRGEAYDKELTDNEAALAKTRQEWLDAIAKAKAERAAVKPDEKAPSAEDYKKKLQDAGDYALSAPLKGEVMGTFSAEAVNRMGFGSTTAERTAKATEETAKNTDEISRKLDEMGLDFE